MQFSDVLLLFTGLAVFLYGMELMGEGFKHMAGNKLQAVLEKLTSKPIIGLLAGIVVTAIIQSSSAVTSMLVGFVNAGIMNVAQTVSVIMGTNVGTTVTGQLMALNLEAIAPIFAFAGVCLIMFFSGKERVKALGEVLAGFGFLFIGMSTMGESLQPLQTSPFFLDLIVSLRNPILGILVGAVFTAMIQSSSASLGIIQTMARGGLLGIQDVVYFNLGQNIGTTSTALLASLGFNRDSKRVAIINFAFNFFVTILFGILYSVLPLHKLYMAIAPDNPVAQIATMHTFVNVVGTLVFLPINKIFVKIAYLLIPDHGTEKKLQPEITQPAKAENNSAIVLYGLSIEMDHMFELVKSNVNSAIQAILDHVSNLQEIEETEKEINQINKGISKNLSILMASNLTMSESLQASQLFSINVDLERMGDHAINIAQSGDNLLRADKSFNMETYDQLLKIYKNISESMEAVSQIVSFGDTDRYIDIVRNEEKLDDYCRKYREDEIQRIKNVENDDVESSVLFTELLIDLERIGDHIMNVAQSLNGEAA
ncbi:MAG: Na/Pi cotransporter family protein [Erysipelotrichaceae bacterium]|nr:Na/Pi cotransporter family protein [Erysipelotrichaceae bacterium]